MFKTYVTALLCACVLLTTGAAARDKPDRTDKADIVQGDWIKPADVLLIGDSESLGYFGAQLYRSLSLQPDPRSGHPLKVWSYWTCGSDVESWLQGDKSYCGIRTCNGAGDCARDHGPEDRPGRVVYRPLRSYMAIVKPRLTIVSLGSNMLTWRNAEFRDFYPTYLAEIGQLIGDIAKGGSQCVWIGPPQASLKTKPQADYEKFVADVGRTVRAHGCAFIDSNPLSDRKYVLHSDSEGIHYEGAGERAWETKVWVQLQPLLAVRLSR